MWLELAEILQPLIEYAIARDALHREKEEEVDAVEVEAEEVEAVEVEAVEKKQIDSTLKMTMCTSIEDHL
jgi:hypothetical protein